MNTAAFDTLEATEDLKAVGLEGEHAKAIVRTVHRSMAKGTGGMAAKEHVTAEIAALRADVYALLRKTAAGIVVANVSITIALMKLLP